MISGDQIQTIIREPSALQGSQLDDLNALVKKYPYCSSLHMLLLKGMAMKNDLNFERQLKIVAAHVHDRAHLYQLIHTDETVISESEEIAKIAGTKSIPEPQGDSAKLEHEDEHVPASEMESNDLPNSNENEEVEGKVIDETEKAPLDLEEVIIAEAIDQNYVDKVLTPDSSSSEPIPEQIDDHDVKKEIKAEVDADQQTNVSAEDDIIEENESDQPLSFVEWLRSKQTEISSVEEVKQTEENESTKKSIVKDESSAINANEKTKLKSKTDALLEKFISEEPKISRPVKDFYNPVKTAKKSIEESDDLVSETLAKIHLMQKNYGKAISAYQKLILLYPEKKAFFADQIKKIEEIKKK